jgi:GH25 family lysozyme M1 (1,4-beta-N-acetylmuramidase)
MNEDNFKLTYKKWQSEINNNINKPIQNKYEALFKIEYNYFYYFACNSKIQNDKDVVIMTVKKNPVILNLISPYILLFDIDIIKTALKTDYKFTKKFYETKNVIINDLMERKMS